VFRSNTNIYAQIIDDEAGKTLVAAGTRDKALRTEISNGSNCTAAEKIGEIIAKKALDAGIVKVAFDRHGFKYHGRIKALADAARKAGLDIGAAGEEKVKSDAKSAPKKQKVSKNDKLAAKASVGKATSNKKQNK
jgi:large subunit ribosomal protein L18